MTKTKQTELKISNQVLATLVVLLSLGLGYMVSKEQGWVKTDTSQIPVSQRIYINDPVELPNISTNTTIMSAITKRRTRGDFISSPITLTDLHSILWSMQGITADWGGRAVPTSKSIYPLQISIVVNQVEGLSPGVYQFDTNSGTLLQTHDQIPDRFTKEIQHTPSISSAPVVFILSGDKKLLVESLNQERDELMYLEAGHAIQNAFLAAESVQLGIHPTITYDSEIIKQSLNIPSQEIVLSMFSMGQPKEW